MYVDAAHTLFRRQYPETICLVSSPCMSIQKGSPSSLNSSHWYDRSWVTAALTATARNLRDACWRHGLITVGPKGENLSTVSSAMPWPNCG